MDIAAQVLRRFVARDVRVLVDRDATLKLRERFHEPPDGEGSLIGTFDSDVSLYRIMDGEELRKIATTGKILGGMYSIKAERAHGASWGENITSIISWGNNQRGKRLGDDLFVAKIDARGKRFFHMNPNVSYDSNAPPTQTFTMDVSKCNTGLGCSVIDVSFDEATFYRVDVSGHMTPFSDADIRDYVKQRGPEKVVELRKISPVYYHGTIRGTDVYVVMEQDDNAYKGTWSVVTRDEQKLIIGAKTDKIAIDRASKLLQYGFPEHVTDLLPKSVMNEWRRRQPPPRRYASLALRVAERHSMEFPTQDALKTYVQEHPKADLKNHWVKKPEQTAPKEEPKGSDTQLNISDAEVDAALKEYESDLKMIKGAMQKAFDAFKVDPKNERLRKKVEHLPEAEQMLFVAGHEVGAYFEDMVVKDRDLHMKLTNQWRKNSDNEICLELTGLLHSMGVEGHTRASDKKNHTDISLHHVLTPAARLKKVREKGANSKALQDYVKEAVTFQRAFFKYAGIKELSVYRGVKRQADKFNKDDEVTLNCREASSFTLDPGVAKAFGRVIAYKVPVESVLMSPLTSPHFASSLGDAYVAKDKYRGESELVLMGGSTLKGKVLS